jgi:hypothetical protein
MFGTMLFHLRYQFDKRSKCVKKKRERVLQAILSRLNVINHRTASSFFFFHERYMFVSV